MKDLTVSRPFNEDEYNELLRQAVAVIETSRLQEHLEVELALQDVNKPIGVAKYQYLLPKNKLQELVANEMKNSSNEGY